MTIIGQSHTKTIINGNGTNWIFKILPGINVTLRNLKLTKGYVNGSGGAIQNQGILTAKSCTIINNTSSGDAGAILNYYMFNEKNSGVNTCVLNLNNCILTDNNARGNGGAISNQCTIKVKDKSIDACVLNLNNCILTGNNAGGDGGAISNHAKIEIDGTSLGACVLNLNNCTLSNNKARENGGAISSHGSVNINGNGLGACVLNLNNCTLSNNKAKGDGGGVLNHCLIEVNGSGLTKTTLNVDECTFTDNTAGGVGGAISNSGTAKVFFNRITGNTAHLGNAIYTGTSMNVTDNWWGSNFPDFKSLISATDEVKVLHTPWLYLTFTANPTTIPAGFTSTLKASFNQHTDGTIMTPINPVNGHIPDETPVIFTTNLGNVGSKSVEKYTILGLAYASLRGDEGSGIASVDLIADSQTLNTTLVITSHSTDTSNKTIGMQNTGIPLTEIVLAILLVIGGLLTSIGYNKN